MDNKKLVSLFWGVALIAAGGLALAETTGYLDSLEPTVWIFVFAGISLVSLVTYFVSGVRNWGWLFPAGIFGALAILIGLAVNNVDSPAMASPLFIGIGLPFVVAYLLDRPRNWWALIPAGVMLFLTITLFLADSARGEYIGALFLFGFAAAFLVVYLADRSRIWAAIVAYVFFVLGFAPILATGGESAAYFGSIFLFGIALPFFVLYFRSLEHWWTIIPAGTLTTAGIVATLAIANVIRGDQGNAWGNALMMAGLAATFAVVWLRHHRSWAGAVTAVLAVLAVASLFFASNYNMLWPVAIILLGGYLLFNALRPRAA